MTITLCILIYLIPGLLATIFNWNSLAWNGSTFWGNFAGIFFWPILIIGMSK